MQIGQSSKRAELVCSIECIRQTPWMIEENGALRSETRLLVRTAAPVALWCKVSVEGLCPSAEFVGELSAGENEVTVRVPELLHDGDLVVFELYDHAECDGEPLAAASLPQKKIRRWRIYIAHDLHMDIGYTDDQETLRNVTFPSYLDDALRYIDETEDWNSDAKFKYPMEASYLLYGSAWHVRDADWIENVKRAVKEGTLSFPSNYAHFVLEGMGTEATARMSYVSERFLKDMLGAESTKVSVKTDDPGISWGSLDALADAGVKYLMLRFNDPDWETSFGTTNTDYPKLFYMRGKNPDNKLLAYDGPRYALEEYGFDFKNADTRAVFENIATKLMDAQSDDYPYDAVIQQFTTPWDNNGITPQVKDNIKALSEMTDAKGRTYVYPKIVSSTTNDFFQYIESNYAGQIPEYQGTIESWWAFGPSSGAYEVGINKMNHDKLPAAECFAALASVLVPGTKYPYEKLLKAYDHMMLFDEHTWSPNPQLEDNEQWNWKRNLAISANRLSESVLSEALQRLNRAIPADGRSVVVYNALSWERSGVVAVESSKLPECFEIVDPEKGESVPYQRHEGKVLFVAENVPGLGYKCYEVKECGREPAFAVCGGGAGLSATENRLENRFFTVTFDAAGSIVSIIDKRNGGKEMVDGESSYGFNQFVYYNTKRCSREVLSEQKIEQAVMHSSSGPVMAVMTAEGPAPGAKRMKRQVILYDAIPRIDIVNEVDKREAPLFYAQDEEAFFTFPFRMQDFEIRHEMPAGDVKPHGGTRADDPLQEQFLHSCTDHYTVNRWIDISNGRDYGIAFAPVNTPLVQYGGRTSFQKRHDYCAEKPWIFSYAFNNKWFTNFPKTQPGPVTLRYSIASHGGSGWKDGRVDRFGWETAGELRASLIDAAQPGNGLNARKGSFLPISSDRDNVVLTAAKIAEANGEGIILRFNETIGVDTAVRVDLSLLSPELVYETNIVEEDRSLLELRRGIVTFRIKGYGWATLRVIGGASPSRAAGVTAGMLENGTLVSWDESADPHTSYYEVYRDVTPDFAPGPGNYIASVSNNRYYDKQVKPGLSRDYYYKVRSVGAGGKGYPSASAKAQTDSIMQTIVPPAAPPAVRVRVLSSGRVSVEWDPPADTTGVAGYKVYRNGLEIKDVPAIYNSHLDLYVVGGQTLDYTVRAYDAAGELSSDSPAARAITPPGPPFTLDISEKASITASSYTVEWNNPRKAVDGWIGLNGYGEWVSEGELTPWIQYSWDGPVTIDTIVIADRPDPAVSAGSGMLEFSDGTALEVPHIPEDGASIVVSFAPKTVRWVRLQIQGGSGGNVGLSEMRVYAAPSSSLQGKASASSVLDAAHDCFYAVSGITGVALRNEWASRGERNPWIRIDFDAPKRVGRAVIYDRPSPDSHANEGVLRFSDGSSVIVKGIPKNGDGLEIRFSPREAEWLIFTIMGGEGEHVGLNELDVYET